MSEAGPAPMFGGLDPVEALLAIEEIKRLRSFYFYALDRKDWAGYVSVFTPDAFLDFSGEVPLQVRDEAKRAALPADAFTFRGAQAAADQFSVGLADAVTTHQGHDPLITLTGPGTATGITAMWDCLDFGHELFQGYGHYHERYRKLDGRWLIEWLKLTRIRAVWQPVEQRWSRP